IGNGDLITIFSEEMGRIFSINSGGILNLQNLNLTGGGSFAFGGGIENHGILRMTSCSVYGNSSTDQGGGIFSDGTLIMTSCTVSGNSSKLAGGVYVSGTATLTSCTIAGNSANLGGGVVFGGTVNLSNSIIANNFASEFPNFVPDGIFNSDGTNASNTSPSVFVTGDLVSVPIALLPLGDYGGGTRTMPPCNESLVVGMGAVSQEGETDQRGNTRSSPTDIGATQRLASDPSCDE
ncbi:MAG: hypothetical protein KDK61_00440, partial [Simkania sp.]|nr:hypothetical protein [Simkania sp.]